MPKLPPSSLSDTPALAARYSETSAWQHERGLLLIDIAEPSGCRRILDLGCGTGELSAALARRAGPSGQVTAIDPDPARLDHARKNAPPDLDNLTFEQATADDVGMVGDGSIDLVYSNYALHWMLDLPPVFDEIQRVLRPGGRFVTEFLGQPIALFMDLIRAMPGGENLVTQNIFLDEREWRAIIEPRGFDILDFAWPRFMLDYEDLPAMLTWLEATSHGFFDRDKLDEADRAALARDYPGAVTCECQGLRMVLRRPT